MSERPRCEQCEKYRALIGQMRGLADSLDGLIAAYKTPGEPDTYGAYQEGRADLADTVLTQLELWIAQADAPSPQGDTAKP